MVEYREWQDDANVIRNRISVTKTFRGRATAAMRERGLANWALSMGRQRLGGLFLQNHPQFLPNLHMPRLKSDTQRIDVAALDLIRDRERGRTALPFRRRNLSSSSSTPRGVCSATAFSPPASGRSSIRNSVWIR